MESRKLILQQNLKFDLMALFSEIVCPTNCSDTSYTINAMKSQCP